MRWFTYRLYLVTTTIKSTGEKRANQQPNQADGFKVRLPGTLSRVLSQTQATCSMWAITIADRVERTALWARLKRPHSPHRQVMFMFTQAASGILQRPMSLRPGLGDPQAGISTREGDGMDKLLSEVDSILAQIRVSGNDVFFMAEARRRLKTAYDSVKEAENG